MISVVIPAYNVEKYISECLDCVQNQTYTELEIIVVDDSSTDRTYELACEYAKNDNRIKVLKKEHAGAGAARNYAIPYAKGKYISFLDADDFYERDMFEKMLLCIEENDADVCVCKSFEYDDRTRTEHIIDYSIIDAYVPVSNVFSWRDNGKYILNFCNGWPWDKLYKKSFIEKNELRFQEIRTSNDTLFVLSSLVCADKICTLREPLIHHRVNNNSSLSNTRQLSFTCCFEAARALYDKVSRLEQFEYVKQSLYTCVANFLIWHLTTITGECRKKVYDTIKNEMIPLYGFLDFSKEFYHIPSLLPVMQKIHDYDYQYFLIDESVSNTIINYKNELQAILEQAREDSHYTSCEINYVREDAHYTRCEIDNVKEDAHYTRCEIDNVREDAHFTRCEIGILREDAYYSRCEIDHTRDILAEQTRIIIEQNQIIIDKLNKDIEAYTNRITELTIKLDKANEELANEKKRFTLFRKISGLFHR